MLFTILGEHIVYCYMYQFDKDFVKIFNVFWDVMDAVPCASIVTTLLFRLCLVVNYISSRKEDFYEDWKIIVLIQII